MTFLLCEVKISALRFSAVAGWGAVFETFLVFVAEMRPARFEVNAEAVELEMGRCFDLMLFGSRLPYREASIPL